MNPPQIVVLSIVVVWLVIAAVVIGYPLVAGRMRAGLDSVNRETEPEAFWKAYVFSTSLFLAASIGAAFVLWSILH